MNYSFLRTLKKGGKYALIFVLAAVIDKFIISFPEIAGYEISTYTIGAIMVMLLNFVKVKLGFNPTLFGKELL